MTGSFGYLGLPSRVHDLPANDCHGCRAVVRVVWLGRTLFDHVPQLRVFAGYGEAVAFASSIDAPVWLITDEVSEHEVGTLWPPAVGDYPDNDENLWPWEQLTLASLVAGVR